MKQLKNKNKMSGRIYSIPNGHQLQGGMDACEAKREDIEDRFVRSLAEMICEKLEIGYNDRRITNTLLVQTLKNELNSRDDNNPGMLQQYLAHELEEVFRRMKTDLLVPDDVKINHDYHIHSKFNSFIDYMKKNYIRKEDINSDGTFSTIEEKGRELRCANDGCTESAGPSSER